MIDTYLQHGWSLIPIRPGDKRPVGQWQKYQTERATPQQVEAWLDEEYNLAVVTGELSGVVVVDCDSRDAMIAAARKGLPVTPTATTGKGCHYFFAWTGPVRNAVRLESDIDIRGDGGYVIIPPSVHPNGRRYEWVAGLSLEDVALAPCPAWVLAGAPVSGEARPAEEWAGGFAEPVANGSRNHTCASLAGYLLRKYVDAGVVTELMMLWNERRCSPPMSAGEVHRVVRSIATREARRRELA